MRYVSFTESKLSLLIIESLSLISSTHEKNIPKTNGSPRRMPIPPIVCEVSVPISGQKQQIFARKMFFFSTQYFLFWKRCLPIVHWPYTWTIQIYTSYRSKKKHDDISLRCDKGMFLQHRHGWWFSMEASHSFEYQDKRRAQVRSRSPKVGFKIGQQKHEFGDTQGW